MGADPRQDLDGLVAIGTLFGDDEALMRAKADCVYQILRQIVEDVPSVQITTRMPENLSEEQLELLTGAIKDAALKGIEIAMTHSVQILMSSIYDLCTSKLHAGRLMTTLQPVRDRAACSIRPAERAVPSARHRG